MIINRQNLANIHQGFKATFARGFDNAPSSWKTVAMEVPSSGESEVYSWLGMFPEMREWIGDRVIQNLALHQYAIINRKFEQTIEIDRTKIEDDKYGVYGNVIEEMGRTARQHPDSLVYEALRNGFDLPCYDGQYFFDAEHAVIAEDGETVSVSNVQAGSGEPWFLMDCSRAFKPLIFQKRASYDFQRITGDTDEHVFMRDTYLHGVRGRGAAGFGLWQLAFGSKADLTIENFEAARAALTALRGDKGRRLGVMPTHLVVPPSLEGEARRIVKNETRVATVDSTAVAVANEWAGSAELLVSPFL